MSSVKADLSNWRDSPQNQWSFINVDKILKTDTIKKSDSKASRFTNEPRQFDDFKLEHDGKTLDLAAFLAESQGDGLIVLQQGKVLFEEYLNGNTRHSTHILMSLTKSVVGLLVGILQEQGKLHVDDLVSKYIPEVSDSFYKDVTIRQAIDMRSGAKYLDATHAYRAAAGWNPLQGNEDHKDLHAFIANFQPERAEDDRFEYVSVNTDMIGWVCERAGGKKIAELISELLWQPMGAESDALMALDQAGNARPAGGLCATLRDLARIGEVIAKDGDGIVPAGWIQDIVRNGDKEAFAKGAWGAWQKYFQKDFTELAYRSYCLADSASETVMGIGIYGQNLLVDRKAGLVVAKTASQVEASDFGRFAMTVAAFQEFKRILQ